MRFRAVLDEYMLDIMYELPEHDNSGVTYVVDADDVENNTPFEKLTRRKAKESA